jgi:type VI secretion system protein VasD
MLRRAPPTFALLIRLLATGVLVGIGGCASAGKTLEAAGEVTNSALRLIGLVPKNAPQTTPQPTTIVVRLQASPSLNVSPSGQSLSLVTRIYKLKGTQAFLSAPYEAFANPARERDLLGEELVEVREIQMLPGQQREWREAMPADAAHLGIVSLFRAPDPQRWRLAFGSAEAAKSGVSVGLHACGMSVAIGQDLAAASSLPLHAGAACPSD